MKKKLLNGSELAGFIKERQARQVRSLKQSNQITPHLAIVHTGKNPVTDVYLRLKRSYGEDIGVEVVEYNPASGKLLGAIDKLNSDDNTHGIIIQLPLDDIAMTDEAVARVSVDKDVDGLNPETTKFIPATAMSIDWLLAGYNIDLNYKKIVIVGNGRLVGAPLAKLWRGAGYDVMVCDSKTSELRDKLYEADVIVSATGVAGLITTDMVKKSAVVVDAGTSSEGGKVVGDVANDVRARDDVIITPEKGGVGPLTVAALFDNVILAVRK